MTMIRGHSHQKGIIIPDSFQFLFLDFPDEKSEALERSPRWGLSARRRPDTGRPRSAELLLPPCSPRGRAWLSPRSLCLTRITPARSPRGPRPSAIEGLAQWPSAPRRIRMPAAAAYLGGLPGSPEPLLSLSLLPSSWPSAFCCVCCRLSLWHTSKACPTVRTIRIAWLCGARGCGQRPWPQDAAGARPPAETLPTWGA